uniref:GmrSD restriction endonucleases N-terminal domain-containing protein n=1 Tax=Burkholderia sp. M701 TaxID=326454 RepID=V5YNB3_9BURK|nr:DUF262 domain-containing protein [Burkholderia sp. M701]BAO18892.1 protein of unknown function DUF262 [Burkholderia sp. M701]
MRSTTKPMGVSDSYWSSLTDEYRAMYEIVRPMARATYEVDIQLGYVEKFLEGQRRDVESMGGVMELDPDFQRGHKWDATQRTRYIESLIRGCAPRNILFNCPGYTTGKEPGDIPEHTFQCIDGLQRITTVRKFMAGEFCVFENLKAADLKGSPFDPSKYRLRIAVYEFSKRADLLQFYIDLNAGGTAHSEEEIERVRKLRDAAAAAS